MDWRGLGSRAANYPVSGIPLKYVVLLVAIAAAGALILVLRWQVGKLDARVATLLDSEAQLKVNERTCLATNADLEQAIDAQAAALHDLKFRYFAASDDNRRLAEELAAAQLRRMEESREAREEVRTVLAGETCAAEPMPVDARRVFNAAICRASGRPAQDCRGTSPGS